MSRPFRIRRLLLPLGWIFGQLARLRRRLYQRGVFRSYKASIPTICVGNIAIGGTGKTPHASYIVNLLSQQHHVAMLSRGYGRKSKGFVLANTTPPEHLTAQLIGDEPLLLHNRFPQLPIAVDGDREHGVQKLQDYDPSIQVIVMDDAYQHLSFTPSVKMVLTEYHRPYFLDYPLPAGRLREFPDAVAAADLVLVTKTDRPDEQVNRTQWRSDLGLRDDQPLFFTCYRYGTPEPVTAPATDIDPSTADVVLLSGIARPQPLEEHLRQHYRCIRHVKFPDHHNYTSLELKELHRLLTEKGTSPKVLFTTEKDWMRLQSENLQKDVSLLPVFIVPIEVDFLTDKEKNEFNHIIEDYVTGDQTTHS
ncbi:MAG: tetraacyldisaccharide 4'-kinase [Bacteroidales bacterium]|nr:tetraacyldisaccharide 4'-kinase [Bacteroidales bacterium]